MIDELDSDTMIFDEASKPEENEFVQNQLTVSCDQIGGNRAKLNSSHAKNESSL